MNDPYLVAALLGFGGGVVAVTVLGGAYLGYRRLQYPGRRAGIRRAVKFLGFQVAGLLLANGAYLATMALLHTSLDPARVQVLGAGIGSLAAGVQKSRSWQEVATEYHVEPATLDLPTATRSMVAPQDPSLPAG